MAAPVIASTASAIANGPSSVTCNKPTGTASGDVLYASAVCYNGDAYTFSTPSGWTLVRGPDRRTGSAQIAAYIFRKVAGGSEPANYTFTASTGTYLTVWIARVTGVDTTTPEDASTSGNNGTGSPRTGTGITTSGADRLLLLCSLGYGVAPTSTPTGMTQVEIVDTVTGYYSQTIASAGATGDRSHTQNSGADPTWVTQMIAIRPAASASYTLTADSGTFSLSGQDAGLNTGHLLTADYGTFSLAGQDAGLLVGKLITADYGAFTLAGQDAGLTAARLLTADYGAFTLTGQDAGFFLGRAITADYGAFTLVGQDAGLLAVRLLTADYGAFTLAGQDAGFVLGYSFSVDYGAFTLTGQDAGLIATRLLTADYGAFALAGQDAGLLVAHALAADYGAFTLAGQDAGLLVGRVLTAEAGIFTLAGQDAVISFNNIEGYLAATDTPDSALIYGTVTGTGQFTVSGPYVIQAFTTDALSFPYDIRQRTA